MTERPAGPHEVLRERIAETLSAATATHDLSKPYWLALADAVLALLTAERERDATPEDVLRVRLHETQRDLAGAMRQVRRERERADALQRQVDAARALCERAEAATVDPGLLHAAQVLAILSRTATKGRP